jgi:hypothetical protein
MNEGTERMMAQRIAVLFTRQELVTMRGLIVRRARERGWHELPEFGRKPTTYYHYRRIAEKLFLAQKSIDGTR